MVCHQHTWGHRSYQTGNSVANLKSCTWVQTQTPTKYKMETLKRTWVFLFFFFLKEASVESTSKINYLCELCGMSMGFVYRMCMCGVGILYSAWKVRYACEACVFAHSWFVCGHVLSVEVCIYVWIYGYVSVYHECNVRFQKRESQPSRTLFTGAQLEVLFWPDH